MSAFRPLPTSASLRLPPPHPSGRLQGLLLNCMEKKEEAYDLVRKGIKLDIKSQVCCRTAPGQLLDSSWTAPGQLQDSS